MADKAVVTQTTLDAIGQAIIDKGGATAPMTPAQMPGAIASIPTGEKPLEPYDGDDTVLDVVIEDGDPLDIEMWIQPLRTNVCYIDWGDGTQTDPLDFTAMTMLSHTFSEIGHYEVRVKNVDGVTGLTFTHKTSGNFATNYAPYRYGPNLPTVRRLLIGTNYDCSVPDQLIYSWQHLLELNINPTNASTGFGAVSGTWKRFGDGSYNASRSLRRLSFLPASKAPYFDSMLSAFSSLYEIGNFDFSGTTNCSSMFTGCRALSRLPDVLDLSACTNCSSMFNGCHALQRLPDVLDLSACTNCSSMFVDCFVLQRVPDVLDLSACTNCSSMFSNCFVLQRVPDVLDLSACTNCASMFSNCRALSRLPDVLDLSQCTNCASMFYYCVSLTVVPDVLDLSACTNCSSMFGNCASLEALPTHVTTKLGISFNGSKFVSRESVATFDTSGNVVGGFVGNLNVKPEDAGTQTMTFTSETKAKFTDDEWTAVKTCLADKGWACSPA